MGHPLTLDLPENLYASLVRRARESDLLPEELALQILERASRPLGDDPLEPFIGALDSGGVNWVESHDEHLATSRAGALTLRSGRSDA